MCSTAKSIASYNVDTIVIGSGVIGLAVARVLSTGGKEVLVLDRGNQIGSETSSRNSQVIHAGLYYPTESLKARLCVRGRHLLYDYCNARSIPYNQCGKLIVASTKQQMQNIVPRLHHQAIRNNVLDTELLSAGQVKDLEPEIESFGALLSPSTGIIDAHELMLHLLADLESNNGTLALHAKVEELDIASDGTFNVLASDTWISCRRLVNCAGLWAHLLAQKLHQNLSGHIKWQPPRQYYAKGTYFRLQGSKSPFTHLVYPVPDPSGGLGVHATLDLASQIRFGPDVEWLDLNTNPDKIDLKPDESRASSFYSRIRQYWPYLQDNSLVADYSGIRAKLYHPSLTSVSSFESSFDFMIAGPKVHSIPNLVHLLGIESPGLTSSLAIAEWVATILGESVESPSTQ